MNDLDQLRGTHQAAALTALRQSEADQLDHEELQAALGLDALQIRDLMVNLEDLGYLRGISFDAYPLSLTGQQVADALIQDQETGLGRADTVQRAVINGLLANPAGGWQITTTKDGRPVEAAELHYAISVLEGWGLVSVVRAWGNEPIRVDIS